MKSLLLLAALSCAAIAQTFDGINAPASRTVTLAADEATFTITVAAGLDSTQQQVKQALQNAGLPNPTVVATGLGQVTSQWFASPVQMLYSATATIAAGSAIDTAKNLESLRTSPPILSRACSTSVTFNPSQAKIEAMRQTRAAATGGRFPEAGPVPGIGRGSQIGSHPVHLRFARRGRSRFCLRRHRRAAQRRFLAILGALPFSAPSNLQVTFSINVVFAVTP